MSELEVTSCAQWMYLHRQPSEAAFPVCTYAGLMCKSTPQGLGRAVAVLYNATEDQPCLKLELSGPAGGPGLKTWLYQTCTELMPQEQPFFPANGRTDMFWDQGVSAHMCASAAYPGLCGRHYTSLSIPLHPRHTSYIVLRDGLLSVGRSMLVQLLRSATHRLLGHMSAFTGKTGH